MKQTIIKCDHCREPITEKHDWIGVDYEIVDLFEKVDLCHNCVYKLNEIVALFINRKVKSKE